MKRGCIEEKNEDKKGKIGAQPELLKKMMENRTSYFCQLPMEMDMENRG
jgi:hypothetical protein